ncbi:MAG: nucleoside deaminase [Bacteroidetes bacterium]|nr:nucleoside deaminase [Bacteroidota bacterium]
MTNQQLFIRKATKLSLENVQAGKGGPFAALIVKDNNIIAAGTNLVTSTNDPTAHAEIGAIREACRTLGTFNLDGCEIYASCEPCPMCLGAIYWARLSRIYIASIMKDAAEAGFDDALIYSEFTKQIGERKIPMTLLPQNEALLAFKEWKEKKDKIKY